MVLKHFLGGKDRFFCKPSFVQMGADREINGLTLNHTNCAATHKRAIRRSNLSNK